jgi:hypothetical protein
LDFITTRAWSEGNKNGGYPGAAPAARGASWAHPNGIQTANNQNSEGGTATPWYSWGPNTNAAFTWGTDTSGNTKSPTGAGGGDPYDSLLYTVTDIASFWSAGTRSNFGFCVNFDAGGNFQYYSREFSLTGEPVLFIDYTPAPDTPVVVNYPGATNVLYNTADLGGVLSSTGAAPTEVRVYYGRQDQYPSTNGWEGVAEIGNPQGVGPFVAHVTGLLDGTGYVYRCYATNSFGDCWATQATAFVTLPLALTINNSGGATGITATVASLNGFLVSTGGAPTAVWVFMGTNGATGGLSNTDKSLWQTNFFIGNNIPFQTYVTTRATGLQYSTVYYYSYYASNSLGLEAWAGVTNFQTLAPTDYIATNNAAWNLNSTWKPSTGYPNYPDDSATIASNTVTVSGYAIPTMRYINITTNGSKTGTVAYADATFQSAPVQLSGGTLQLDCNAPTVASNQVTVKAASQIFLAGVNNGGNGNAVPLYGDVMDWVQGGVTNTGMIHLLGSYWAKMNFYGRGNHFSGGWEIIGGTYSTSSGYAGTGGMILWSDGGLGSGTAIVRNAFSVCAGQTGSGSLPPPARVVVANGGVLAMGNNYGISPVVISNWEIEVQSGGMMTFGAYGIGQYVGGHLFVTSNLTFYRSRNVYSYAWYPDTAYGGQIVGNGRITIDATRGTIGGSEFFRLSGNNTNFSGGITLLYAPLSIENTNALGTGDSWFDAGDGSAVTLLATPATNWSLANNIGGINTIQVQDGTSNYTFTVAGGTLQPGTNVNNSGKLTVGGRLQFAPKPAGGYSTLIVDVTGYNGVAGVDYDQLVVTRGGLAGTISQCDLQIKVVPTVEQLDQQTLTIVSSANDNFIGQAFHSVTWVNGVGGQILVTNVVYNNGSIQLQFGSSDPVINNANGATGIAPTSASINGNLTGVGSASTHVYAYWGATDGGTNAGNWHTAVDLGVRGTGAVTTAISGLQGDTVYYYRYYAVNANGGEWAPSTASFRTLLNPFEFSRKMQIRFNGYNRTETLTNFPALVVLSPGITGFKYSAFASANGYDLRFANSNLTKTLYYEVEKWDATSNSCIWVQVDRLASSNDYIWAYYGNPLAASAPPSYSTNGSTWSQGFLGVWHMGQTNALDSSTNQFNGVAQGTVTPTNGIVASANNVLGSSGYVKVPYNPAFDMASDYTVGMWIFSTNSGSRGFLGTYNNNNNGFIFAQNGTTVQFWDNGNWHDSTYAIDTVTGAWKYLVYVRTNTVGSFMVDGAVVGPQIVNAGGPINGTDLYLGAAHWNDSLCGRMDETRLATIARSTNWVWAEYMNMASNGAFATFGQPVNLKTGTSIIFQ